MNLNTTDITESRVAENPLYIRMRSRFDFSGNRTIGEFMMMKATREGYAPCANAVASRKGSPSSRRPLISFAALLISCVMLIVGAVGFVSAIVPEDPAEADPHSGIVHISVQSDPQTLSTIFPADITDITIKE